MELQVGFTLLRPVFRILGNKILYPTYLTRKGQLSGHRSLRFPFALHFVRFFELVHGHFSYYYFYFHLNVSTNLKKVILEVICCKLIETEPPNARLGPNRPQRKKSSVPAYPQLRNRRYCAKKCTNLAIFPFQDSQRLDFLWTELQC